jgi:flagellar basal body rod protein FlgC
MKNAIITVLLLSSFVANAQTTITAKEWQFDGAKTPPGTTIILAEGERGPLLLKNLKGTAEKPILILNKGHVTIKAAKTASYGLKTINCQYIEVVGTMDYGIEVNGGNIGVQVDGLSTNFRISFLEVHNSGFAGIMAKTDPTCDKATQRGYFTMYNVNITNNRIHHVGGEGIYLGNSFGKSGVKATCGQLLPHYIVNANVSFNETDSTGCEGIQVGSVTSGAFVAFNNVKNSGLSPFAAGQSNGIQIGEGTGGICYGNTITNARANGIIVLGKGDNIVSYNTIINSGENGIFADTRFNTAEEAKGKSFTFTNNTILNSKVYAIKLNSVALPMHYVFNNVITGAGIKLMSAKVKITQDNNLIKPL